MDEWKAVPKIPLSDMLNSTREAWLAWKTNDAGGSVQGLAKRMYECMLAAAPTTHVAVKRELLEWVWTRVGKALGVYHAGGSFHEPIDVWSCFGCGAEVEAPSSPDVTAPADFPHAKDCKFVALRALLSQKGE